MNSRTKGVAAWLIVAAIAIVGYLNSFSAPFVFDDRLSVIENPSIRQLFSPQVIAPPIASSTGGRPVANLSFALNYALGGSGVWSYHFFNVGIHCCTALLVYGAARRTLLLVGKDTRWAKDSRFVSVAMAALWAAQPLLTEAVTYISQRTELLMAFFYVLTLYAFIRASESKGRFWPALSIAACAAGMASKQTMVTAPVVVLLYDCAFVSGSFTAAHRRHWRFYLGLGASWVVLGFCLAGVQHQNVGYADGVPVFDYSLTECRAVCLYLSRTIWPHPLVFDYGPNFLTSVSSAFPYAIVLIGGVTATIWAICSRLKVGYLGCWYFVLLAPTSSVVPIALQPIAESRAYLPSIAFVAALVMGLYLLLSRRGLIAVGISIGAMMALTARRNVDYRDDLTLWTRTVAAAPANARAHYCLGFALEEHGRIDAAMTCYREALRIQPNYGDAHCNLGNALLARGNLREAGDHYTAAIQANPGDARAHSNLGIVLLRTENTRAALEHFELAVRLQPTDADFHYNYAVALATNGERPHAIQECEATLSLNPNYSAARETLERLRRGSDGKSN